MVPIWFPHCPAWMWTISRMFLSVAPPVCRCSVSLRVCSTGARGRLHLLWRASTRPRPEGPHGSSLSPQQTLHLSNRICFICWLPHRRVDTSDRSVMMLIVSWWRLLCSSWLLIQNIDLLLGTINFKFVLSVIGRKPLVPIVGKSAQGSIISQSLLIHYCVFSVFSSMLLNILKTWRVVWWIITTEDIWILTFFCDEHINTSIL